MKKKLLMLALLIWTTHIVAQKQVHIKDCFDFDWKFTLSDNPEYAKPDYADAVGKIFSCHTTGTSSKNSI